ncbi:MAG TPA: hypothetical protein VFN97_18040 [Actinospica sp.]|nr:hypothetical protein [Actinospica sp.]
MPTPIEVAAVAPVVLVPSAEALAPPIALAAAAEVPGPAVSELPMLAPRPSAPDVDEACEPLSLDALWADAALLLDALPAWALVVPPPLAFASLLDCADPDSLADDAPVPSSDAEEDAERPSDAALESAFDPAPVELAAAPTAPALGPDLASPAVAELVPVPPYALAPEPVLPSPALSPACAGAPSELCPQAPPVDTAPDVGPPPLLLWPKLPLLVVPYELCDAPPFALVGSASDVPVRWTMPRVVIAVTTAPLRTARNAAEGRRWRRGRVRGRGLRGGSSDSSADMEEITPRSTKLTRSR